MRRRGMVLMENNYMLLFKIWNNGGTTCCISNSIILLENNQAWKYINFQGKLSHKHAKWVSLQNCRCFVQHLSGKINIVVDFLSTRCYLLIWMTNDIVGFEEMKGEYATNPYFGEVTLNSPTTTRNKLFEECLMVSWFLFKGLQLCIVIRPKRE